MVLKQFEIVLNETAEGFYHAGDTLSGKVVIAFEDKRRNSYKILRIIFMGQAKNSWLEDSGESKVLEIVEEEEFLNFEAEINLEQSSLDSKSEYGFEYELSDGLPSSFVGTFGKIFYFVKAILEGSKEPKEIVKEFNVQGSLDLNKVPEAGQPAEIKVTQGLLFDQGMLGMESKILKSGFIPGESVYFQSKFTNESDYTVNVSLSLIRETVYSAKDSKVSDTEIIATVQGPTVQADETKTWNGEQMQIPTLSFQCFQNCHLIQVLYRFIIEMEIPSPHINLEGTIPIVIGTVQLKNDVKPKVESLSVQPPTPTPTPRINKNGGKLMRPRDKRPTTTCLVFRPDRPRLKLPEPKPETWGKASNVNVSSALGRDNSLEGLEDEVSDMLVLTRRHEKISTPIFGIPSNNEVSNGKTKYPESYIRKRVNEPLDPKSEKIDDPQPPPPKPARLFAKEKVPKAIPRNKSKEQYENYNATKINENASTKNIHKKETLPYPRSDAVNFPLPDFAFNISINGQKQKAIGWNVTRNTLSLKRAKVASGFILPLPNVGWSADPDVTKL